MMMDTSMDTGGTAFICPECSFNGTSLPELISHLNEAHSEETAHKSEAPPKNFSSIQNEKRSRRKPAFSHQIAPRQSLPLFKQSNVDPGSIHFWNRVVTADINDQRFSQSNGNSNNIRDENVMHSNISPQRAIAPKITTTPTKLINSTTIISPSSFYSPSMQAIQKNFKCRICHLTYKNFHDCTAHIRRKHEITHAQAGRYVEKLDTDVPLPPSATGHYKIRLKVKSLPPPITTAEDSPQSKNWSNDLTQHSNYSLYEQEDTIHKNGLSALLIDDYSNDGPNQNDEIIMIEEDADDDDDENDALWKYQQEINNLSESTINNHNSLIKPFKKFQCPHCEHSAPTLTKLKLHIATHINIKPFMCSICGWRANLRWYIQCHAKKRHPNQNFEVLQLSHEEAEQTINAYMKERGSDTKLHNRHDSKHQYQCSLCQFRSNHPRFIEQHIESNHSKPIKSANNQANYIQSNNTSSHLSNPVNIVYSNFSSHLNFNPNRLYYCSLCYRGYRWRYDVKRHHKTMHETSDDELLKSRNFHYLEYVPQIDSLISASMSSINNQFKHENEIEDDDDDDLKLSIADARTVDITDNEAAALLMIEPEKCDLSQTVINDHPEDSIIVFEEDRIDKSSSPDIVKLSSRPSFKPYRCPYCFYRTNWRTDCLRHIRARHKIEPNQNGYYEMSYDEAEKSYEEYERTFGFIVSKKVLARFTDFRQIEWEDLKKSIWEKIKDKNDFERCIFDRLRPDDYTSIPLPTPSEPPIVLTISNKILIGKAKRLFTCMDCAFRSHRINELDKHICSKIRKFQQEKSHGKFVLSIYECTKCSYRTVNENYAKQHIYLHRLKENKKKFFYYCSSCGYNHRYRMKTLLHIAKYHSNKNSFNNLVSARFAFDADFSIRQTILRRSFIERQLNKPRVFYCINCPFISASILEHDHHRSYHQENSLNLYKCQQCSFASNSSLYTNQHILLHSKQARLFSSNTDLKNLKSIPVSTIYKEILGKHRRYNCSFCKRFASSNSSAVLKHIKNIHAGNNSRFSGSLIIGSDLAKEILLLGENLSIETN